MPIALRGPGRVRPLPLPRLADENRQVFVNSTVTRAHDKATETIHNKFMYIFQSKSGECTFNCAVADCDTATIIVLML
jgi:hypothetical protein